MQKTLKKLALVATFSLAAGSAAVAQAPATNPLAQGICNKMAADKVRTCTPPMLQDLSRFLGVVATMTPPRTSDEANARVEMMIKGVTQILGITREQLLGIDATPAGPVLTPLETEVEGAVNDLCDRHRATTGNTCTPEQRERLRVIYVEYLQAPEPQTQEAARQLVEETANRVRAVFGLPPIPASRPVTPAPAPAA